MSHLHGCANDLSLHFGDVSDKNRCQLKTGHCYHDRIYRTANPMRQIFSTSRFPPVVDRVKCKEKDGYNYRQAIFMRSLPRRYIYRQYQKWRTCAQLFAYISFKQKRLYINLSNILFVVCKNGGRERKS